MFGASFSSFTDDVDLCTSIDNPCHYQARCFHRPDGIHRCECPFLHSGDGRKDGDGCEFRFLLVTIGTTIHHVQFFFKFDG